MGGAGILRSGAGRLRLGWRLVLFAVLFAFLALLGSFFVLPGIPGATLPLVVAAVGSGWVLLAVDGLPPGALGFHWTRAAPAEAAAGVALGVAAALLAAFAIAGAGGVRWSIASLDGATAGAFVGSALGALWLFTLPAAAEEALFRGYPFQALAEAWGPGAALFATSIAFAGIHYWNPNVTGLGMMNILVAGVFLGALYVRTASLWWASGAHLGWNWAHGFLVALPVSGLEIVENPLLEAEVRGPEWVSGGAFGPEGSVFAALVLLAVSAWIWRTGWIRPESIGRGALEQSPLWASRMRLADRAGGGGSTVTGIGGAGGCRSDENIPRR